MLVGDVVADEDGSATMEGRIAHESFYGAALVRTVGAYLPRHLRGKDEVTVDVGADQTVKERVKSGAGIGCRPIVEDKAGFLALDMHALVG